MNSKWHCVNAYLDRVLTNYVFNYIIIVGYNFVNQ